MEQVEYQVHLSNMDNASGPLGWNIRMGLICTVNFNFIYWLLYHHQTAVCAVRNALGTYFYASGDA